MEKRSGGLGILIGISFVVILDIYFIYAAVQGDYGVFREVQIGYQNELLKDDLAEIKAEVAHMENLTRRLSTEYLDLDLLDERARDVLGMTHLQDLVLSDVVVIPTAEMDQIIAEMEPGG